MGTQETVQMATERGSREILCQNKRNKFLHCLKSHFHFLKLFSVEHKKLLDRMLILSTKLKVIESDNRPKCLPYTNEQIWKVQSEILNALNSIASKIGRNLQQQSKSFINLRQTHEEFIITSKAIDWSDHQSRLCKGSATEKPLFYYVDHSVDIMYCLNVYEKTTQFTESHLDVRDSSSIGRFLNAQSIPHNFHDLITDVLLNSYFVDKADKVRNKS